MIPKLRINTVLGLFVPLLLVVGYFSGMFSTASRLDELESRVSSLEATVTVLSGDDSKNSSNTSNAHTLSGIYIERPERISGDTCSNFYPEGTKVFLVDWDDKVVGTGELGEGSTFEGSLCAQPFQIDDVPEREGYTVYFERRVAGSAYELTLEDIEESNWDIEVRSRYRL